MQSPRELQQLHNWSVNAEIRISWQDGEDGRLERFVQEIAVEVVTTAEITRAYFKTGASLGPFWTKPSAYTQNYGDRITVTVHLIPIRGSAIELFISFPGRAASAHVCLA
jgi:hypothetical protein